MGRSTEYLAAALRGGHSVRASVAGMSMWPVLSPGDVVEVEPLRGTGVPRPGDIVAIREEAGVVVHRLIHAAAGRAVTWGDNATAGDPPRRPGDILGIVRPRAPRKVLPWLR